MYVCAHRELVGASAAVCCYTAPHYQARVLEVEHARWNMPSIMEEADAADLLPSSFLLYWGKGVARGVELVGGWLDGEEVSRMEMGPERGGLKAKGRQRRGIG